VLLKADSGLDREWYGICERHGEESPGENKKKCIYDENGGWNSIEWARITALGSIKVRSNISNSKNIFKR